ncbi:hypothetical protein SprV_0301280400 [Sparganum proliferum]
MSFVALGLALVLIVVSESTANKKYLGTFPKSASKVIIHARLSFEPLLIMAGKNFTYENGSCYASDETRACSLTRSNDWDVWDFAFESPNTLKLPKLEIRGERKLYIVTLFRRPPPDATQDYTFSSRYSLPLVHRSSHSECTLRITIFKQGETECSSDGSARRPCINHLNRQKNIFTSSYTIYRNHDTRKSVYDILCEAEGPKGHSYLSKYVEFPERGGDYRGVYGLRSENRIWFKTWFEPETVRSLVTYKCSSGKCRASGSTTKYQIKKDKVKGVWNFYFDSEPSTTENWVSVHGKRPQDVVIVFHWLYRLPVPEFSFAPLYVRSLTHFPFGRSEEVLVECPLYISNWSPRPKVMVYDNGVAKCSYGKPGLPECEAYKGSSCKIFMIAYRVKLADAPNSPARQILCTSEASGETYYMSHFVQFP